jgi:hypothetical protein
LIQWHVIWVIPTRFFLSFQFIVRSFFSLPTRVALVFLSLSIRMSRAITLDQVWEKISNDIEHLFQYQTIRYSKWMLIYTYVIVQSLHWIVLLLFLFRHIFDYCTNKHSNKTGLYEIFRDYLRNYLENHFQVDYSFI